MTGRTRGYTSVTVNCPEVGSSKMILQISNDISVHYTMFIGFL